MENSVTLAKSFNIRYHWIIGQNPQMSCFLWHLCYDELHIFNKS